MNQALVCLQPHIRPSFRASSGVEPCDLSFIYTSEPIPQYRGTITQWHAHLRTLAATNHEISVLNDDLQD